MPPPRTFVTLGMCIIDEFSYADESGNPTGREAQAQGSLPITSCSSIGGGGTYAAIGARIWLPQDQVGMIVDRGHDWPSEMEHRLNEYGRDMWEYRDQPEYETTRALNAYIGDLRTFKYLTPRIRLTPNDLNGTKLERPAHLHFICSPTRAEAIISEVDRVQGWNPVTIYEPIPDRCIPEELPALIKILPSISILSPNAEEAHNLLSMPLPPTKPSIEVAASRFLDYGVGKHGKGSVVVRCGPLGAYVLTRKGGSRWVDAYFDSTESDRVVDVTGAGNSFLGGLSAGLHFTKGDIYQAAFYASVSASFIVEQEGLPSFVAPRSSRWNGDDPAKRLIHLLARHLPSGSSWSSDIESSPVPFK